MGEELVVESTRDSRIYRWMLRKSSEVWKDDLTEEQYVKRDDVLTPSRLYNWQDEADPVGIYYYVLRNLSIPLLGQDDPLTYNIVCSCELMVRQSWRVDAGSDVLDTVLSGCIGSVYTLPQHRSKGYANYLMKELDNISTGLLGPRGFLSLYSEVDRYYERFGYHSYPVDVIEIPPAKEKEFGPEIEFLRFDEFDHLIGIYREKLASYIVEDKSRAGRQAVAIIPSVEMLEWHHIRSKYISGVLLGKEPENFGFKLANSDDFVIFSHDYGDYSITLHMIYSSSPGALGSLLKALAVEAARIGFKSIHMWESQLYDYKLASLSAAQRAEADAVVQGLNGELHLPNDSLSALKTLDGSSVDWAANHKWPWF